MTLDLVHTIRCSLLAPFMITGKNQPEFANSKDEDQKTIQHEIQKNLLKDRYEPENRLIMTKE